MFILFLLLWALAAILILTNPRNETTRWGSAIAFFSGFGGLAGVMNEMISPFLRHLISNDDLMLKMIQGSVGIFASVSHYVSPYVLLIFSLRYTGIWTKKRLTKWLAALLFSIPIPIMYALFPAYPSLQVNYTLLTLWVAPYVIAANLLLILSAVRERQPLLKQQKGLICIIVCPLTMFSLMTNYVLRMFQIEQAWRYNTWMIAFGFAAFLYFAAKYGLLGVKVRFEKQSLESTLRAVSSGTSFLNHTIKNEITKISMSADNLMASIAIVDPKALENVEVIESAAAHMLAMVNRIQDQMQDIVLKGEEVLANELFERALHLCHPFLEAKRIQVYRSYPSKAYFICDPVHIVEVLCNVIRNAVDAMQTEGELSVSFTTAKKQFTLIVKDNGVGISKPHLPMVFEPFFSTKPNRRENFGLGLSYGYNVMRKHGGLLDIQSEEGGGTAVNLRFPLQAIVNASMGREAREDYSNSTGRRRPGLDQNDDAISSSSTGSACRRVGDEQGRSHPFLTNADLRCGTCGY